VNPALEPVASDGDDLEPVGVQVIQVRGSTPSRVTSNANGKPE
jgi:hypothetical protein